MAIVKSQMNRMLETFVEIVSSIRNDKTENFLVFHPVVDDEDSLIGKTYVVFQVRFGRSPDQILQNFVGQQYLNIEYHLFDGNYPRIWDYDEEIIRRLGNPDSSVQLDDIGTPNYIEYNDNLKNHHIERTITVLI